MNLCVPAFLSRALFNNNDNNNNNSNKSSSKHPLSTESFTQVSLLSSANTDEQIEAAYQSTYTFFHTQSHHPQHLDFYESPNFSSGIHFSTSLVHPQKDILDINLSSDR